MPHVSSWYWIGLAQQLLVMRWHHVSAMYQESSRQRQETSSAQAPLQVEPTRLHHRDAVSKVSKDGGIAASRSMLEVSSTTFSDLKVPKKRLHWEHRSKASTSAKPLGAPFGTCTQLGAVMEHFL